ncbi:hypothetical protein JXA47_03225 [Candidatus Sumerlaeota bacterium]|nr:hypothetical protein [Candidatus Sumerlaeota bacterium]
MFEVQQTYRIGSDPPRKRQTPPRRKRKGEAESHAQTDETKESKNPPDKDSSHRIDIEI